MNPEDKKYDCIIADDHKLDRLAVLSHARRYSFLNIVGVFENALQVLEYIEQNRSPDVLFLDIDMPGVSGLELRRRLLQVPACIFITSHPEFALEGFDTAALDYFVKPMEAARFEKTMQRLEAFLTVHYKARLLDYTLGSDTLFIKDGLNRIKVQLHEILYLEALKDYTSIVTTQKKLCVRAALGNLLKEPGFENFVRIHRGYAVQKHFIAEISSKGVRVNDLLLPVGRTYKEALENINIL